jgi:hypothetical protein
MIRRLGKSLIKKMFPKERELLIASVFLKLKGMASFEQDWWPAVIVRFLGLSSTKVLPPSLTM